MYAIFNIVGPLILLAAIIYFTVRLWKQRPGEIAQAERGARELREELNEDDQQRSEGSR